MTKNTLRSICFLVVLSFFLFLHTPASVEAGEVGAYDKKQESLTSQKKSLENKIQETETQKNSTLIEINKLDKEIEEANNEILELDNKLDLSEKNIEQAQIEIAEKEEELAERTKILEDRLCDIYMQGDANILEVLLDSTNISEFLTRFELLKKIAENDSELLSSLETERKELDSKKSELEKEKENIATIKSSRESKKEELRLASMNKQELVESLDAEKQSYEESLNEIEQQSEKITVQIQEMQAQTSSESSYTGSVPSSTSIWPTPGHTKVTSPYGWRNHPILKSKRFHTGIDIGAPQGATAVAVANGKVISAGWNGGYGNTVIIDHGGGITTLYAHLSAINVSTGTNVSKNQPIAKIGSTGQSSGPHLHFEVRKNGSHTNPYDFLR